MECKCGRGGTEHFLHFDKNSTRMECKYAWATWGLILVLIRIVPEWNVNKTIEDEISDLKIIRIVPEWNVNSV